MDRFFILGNPRSGTTLFRLMLNRHSQICVPPEAAFMVWLYEEFGEFRFSARQIDEFVSALRATRKIEMWRLDFEALRERLLADRPDSYARLIDCVYGAYAREVLRKDIRLMGDKNNWYLHRIDLLARLYPHARLLHIVRDGRSVAASYRDLARRGLESKYAPQLPSTMAEIAREWSQGVCQVEAALAERRESSLTLRFEDLIRDPVATLSKVCGFLGVEFERGMLEYHTTTEQEGSESSEFMQWKGKNALPLQRGEIWRYRSLAEEELHEFTALARDSLVRFGYLKQ